MCTDPFIFVRLDPAFTGGDCGALCDSTFQAWPDLLFIPSRLTDQETEKVRPNPPGKN